MPNVRLLSSIIAEISLIQFSFMVLKGPSNCRNHAISPKGEVSGDELESGRQGSHMEGLKQQMEVIFMADQIPEERQWALILVAGGEEAYNCWDTLEDTVKDREIVQQVWDAFEKSFEQSTSFWHFRDTYPADFRQDESETMADLDLCIKQTVRGCQWKKESEERMIDLLYHATIYYKIRKFVQESDPAALTYELVIEKAKAHERNVLEYKDHQASHRGANSAPSYDNPLLSAHALSKRRPSGRGNNGQRCGKCGKSHEWGNCPTYGKTCNKCQGIK